MAKPLFTIGYEHSTTRAMFDELADAKVDVVIDVRAVSSSRRPGFSKRQLAAGLDERGIGYLHLRALGTPKEGRLAARAGKRDELFRIFEKHLRTPEAREELDELATLAKSGRRRHHVETHRHFVVRFRTRRGCRGAPAASRRRRSLPPARA